MRRGAEGTLENVEKKQWNSLQKSNMLHASLCRGHPRKCWKTTGIPGKNHYFSCIAMPRDPSEILKETLEFLVKINMSHASLCRGIPRNVEKHWHSLLKTIFVMHRYADGTLGMLKKETLEFHIVGINICRALLCRGIPRKCWTNIEIP